jgi:hypothetical protein
MPLMEPMRDFAALLHKAGALTRDQYDEIAGTLEDMERKAEPIGSVSRNHDRQIGRRSRGRDVETDEMSSSDGLGT